jgi:hypothetical protein
MTVYVANSDKKNKHDLTGAMRYGEIRYINHKYIYADEIDDEKIPEAFIRNMVFCAEQFDPDEDYLLILGDHLQFVTFAAILATRYSYFRVLRWTGIEKAYFPVRLELPPVGAELVPT